MHAQFTGLKSLIDAVPTSAAHTNSTLASMDALPMVVSNPPT